MMTKTHHTHTDRTRLKGKLRSHIWSLVQAPSGHIQLLCNGVAFPASGPTHTIDCYTPPWSGMEPEGPQRVRAVYTSFSPDMCLTLVDMIPIQEPEKRLTGRQWYESQKPGTRFWLRERANDGDYPAWIEQTYQASKYLHGFGELAFLVD